MPAVNPLLELLHLRGGPRAIARHLAAAQGAGDGVGMLGDGRVVEKIKSRQHGIPVLRTEQGLNVLLEAEVAFAR